MRNAVQPLKNNFLKLVCYVVSKLVFTTAKKKIKNELALPEELQAVIDNLYVFIDFKKRPSLQIEKKMIFS